MVSTFFFVMDQSSWLITKKKEVGLVRHPQLINMEQNTWVSTLIVCTYKGVCGRDVIMSLLRSCIFLLANFHILVTWNVKQEYFGATSMFFEEKIGGLLERIVLLVKTFVTFWRGAIFCQFFFKNVSTTSWKLAAVFIIKYLLGCSLMILHHKIFKNQTILPINSVFWGKFLHLGDFVFRNP